MKTILSLFLLAGSTFAQMEYGGIKAGVGGTFDFSAGLHTVPNHLVTASQVASQACAKVGETLLTTDTQALMVCTATGTPGTWAAPSVPVNQSTRTIGAVFDGGGSALTGTTTRCTYVPYSGTIQAATLISDVPGTATVDVRTVAYSSYTGPSSASTITGSATPSLSSAAKYQDTTLAGWNTSVAAGTMACFVLASPSTITWAALSLKIAAN